MAGPRVAIVGLILESNRWARPAGREDFTSLYWLEGAAIIEAARAPVPPIAMEAAAFVKAMDATGPWEPVPILLAASHPAGPIEEAVLARALDRITAGLGAAGPVDAVYIANHGGMIATNMHDPDGAITAAVRRAVGPKPRIVMTLDLHANISEGMVADTDLIVGYLTNPHVDMVERGEEAAFKLRLMLAGSADPKAALVRLPLAPATINLLTAEGPYADMIALGQRRQAELAGAILNVSVFGGFVFSDTPKNGIAVVVTARSDRTVAEQLAEEIAAFGWASRARFRKPLTSLSDTLATVMRTDRRPVILAEVADNPGGGGSGRATELLGALIEAGADGVLYGSFFDPALAAECHRLGIGARLRARFNRDRGQAPWEQWDVPLEVDAEVVGLGDGRIVGRLGHYQGRRLELGPSAALRIGGITVVAISDRNQTSDPGFFEMLGLDIGAARTVVVKSRGHFRSGFAPWFGPDQVIEVDTAGLTSPVLPRWPWRHLKRPIYPLDETAEWPRRT